MDQPAPAQNDAPPAPAYRGPDRRQRPTPFVSRYTFLGGRRGKFRRQGEAKDAFVDVYSPRLVVLLLIFFGLTVLDSLATLVYLNKGGEELNPIAQWMLDQGNVPFVLIKGGLTAVCVLFVMMHKNFRYARTAIAVGFAFYFALAVYHIVLQVLSWHVPVRPAA